MKMSPRWRSVCAAALATEVELLWRSQSPLTSMAGTLRSTTNCSLQKLRRARVGDFRFFEASDAARWKGVARWKLSIRAEGGAVRPHHDHVASSLHVAGAPVVGALARRERRRLDAGGVVEGYVDVAQLGGLAGRVEVGGVGADVGPPDSRIGHLVRHGDQ